MDSTATRNLDQPVVDDGIRWLNFFNGRVLSAEDLRTDHDAIAEARRQLGRGVGSGVVSGLEVSEAVLVSSPGAPILTVKKGLGFNEDGQAVELRRDISIGLVRVDAPTGSEGADFSNCDVVLPGTTGLGVYVLTAGPASSEAGKAAVAGLGNSPAACNVAYSVEGVRFKLFPVPLEDGDLDEPDLLRNRLAYRMFGTGRTERSTASVDPFGTASPPTLFEAMQASCFKSADIPVAVLHWEPVAGIQFVDLWSVRRRCAPLRARTALGGALADRTQAGSEAAVLQFQSHLTDLLQSTSVRARDHFEFLPPVGLLPLRTSRHPRGIEGSEFFDSQKVRGPFYVEGSKVDPLLRAGLAYDAIDLSTKELIWLYEIRQNAEAALADQALRPVLMFTTGFEPYAGNAQFDLAYWDFANYALRVS